MTPAKTTQPPPPSRTPDNRNYMPALLPCNVCVADASQNKYSPFLIYKVSNHTYGAAKSWSCRWQENQGCFDLCTWNRNTGKFTAAARSAVDVVGSKCRQGPIR